MRLAEETVRDKRLRVHDDLSLVTEAPDATPPVQNLCKTIR